MKNNFLKFLSPVLLIIFPLVVFAVKWLPLVPCGGTDQPACSVSCFYVMVDNIMNFLLFIIAIPLSATAFMAAGILMVLGGSEKHITLGKDILKFTLIGLLIAFSAWLIIDLILGNLLSQKAYKSWNKFPEGCSVYYR